MRRILAAYRKEGAAALAHGNRGADRPTPRRRPSRDSPDQTNFPGNSPSGIPSNIIPHSKGVKCGLIRSNSPFSYSNHRPAKPKIPKPLVYAQVSPLGTSFATP